VPTEQLHILYHALAGGPRGDTGYLEDRGDYVQNEVALASRPQLQLSTTTIAAPPKQTYLLLDPQPEMRIYISAIFMI